MLPRILVSLIVAAVLAGMVAGCGGQQDTQSQGSEQPRTAKERTKKERTTRTEVVEGVVKRVDLERKKVVVKPEDGERRVFKYKPERFKVTLNGEEAEPGAIEKGQRAAVRFVTVTAPEKNVEQDIARSIKLATRSDEKAGGETTG